MTTFADRFLAGEVSIDDIDDYIDAWHDGTGPTPLYHYLGLSWDEYCAWVQDHASLAPALKAR